MTVKLIGSSNVGVLANTPLARLTIHTELLDRLYERDFTLEITNSDIAERITNCSQEIQILRDVQAGIFRSYAAGQNFIYDDIHLFALKIRYAGYIAYKIDNLISKMSCDWEKVQASLLDSTYQSVVSRLRAFVFGQMIDKVDSRNMGNQAGLYGNYNLGSLTSPLHITPSNVLDVLYQLGEVLREQNHWVDGEMFLVVPHVLRMMIALSPLGNAAFMGEGPSIIVDGRWPRVICGFNVYETNFLPKAKIDGHTCLYMIAGHRDAYTYAASPILARSLEAEDSYVTKIQIVIAWGGAMQHADWLAVAFGYFDSQITF
jgi:hypothetical protein